MSAEKSIQINVPAKFALQKTWQMHFEDNQYTQNTYAHQDGKNSCHREVHLKNGKSVRQKIFFEEEKNLIRYQNSAGYVSGNMEMRFETLNNDPNKAKITAITWAKTQDNQVFPSLDQLKEGLKNSKAILEANYRIDQQIPKCCECKLFG